MPNSIAKLPTTIRCVSGTLLKRTQAAVDIAKSRIQLSDAAYQTWLQQLGNEIKSVFTSVPDVEVVFTEEYPKWIENHHSSYQDSNLRNRK
ncbi:hypothetical protein WA1_49825 [Scytonema hofmannii PCC 7110]|uniref:Uncharacterized protein n=1 Tax=Scytonema hofmannii PCC 7110 TaxID=128403 RepID=A0A139WQW5_9CYAN|nr:hypothetical protein [Scytonema hofmannii]KYC34833.1 hypothetical protein WA1_49825 [Scytonema hofmannii PCC 7110]